MKDIGGEPMKTLRTYRTSFCPEEREVTMMMMMAMMMMLIVDHDDDGENDDEDWISLGFEGGMTTMVMLIKL